MVKIHRNEREQVYYRKQSTVSEEYQDVVRNTEYYERLKYIIYDTYESTGSKYNIKKAIIYDVEHNSCKYGLDRKTAEITAVVVYNDVFGTSYDCYSSCYKRI